MRTFTNVPIHEINCTYEIFAHRSCVIPFTSITIFPYSEQTTVQVLEMIWMLNELIQANEKVFMNFKYIEH